MNQSDFRRLLTASASSSGGGSGKPRPPPPTPGSGGGDKGGRKREHGDRDGHRGGGRGGRGGRPHHGGGTGGSSGQGRADGEEGGPVYRDRAAERRRAANQAYEQEEELMARVDYETSKFLGGDLAHTHLVKGLDFALLRKLKQEAEDAADAALEQQLLDKRDTTKPSVPTPDRNEGSDAAGRGGVAAVDEGEAATVGGGASTHHGATILAAARAAEEVMLGDARHDDDAWYVVEPMHVSRVLDGRPPWCDDRFAPARTAFDFVLNLADEADQPPPAILRSRGDVPPADVVIVDRCHPRLLRALQRLGSPPAPAPTPAGLERSVDVAGKPAPRVAVATQPAVPSTVTGCTVEDDDDDIFAGAGRYAAGGGGGDGDGVAAEDAARLAAFMAVPAHAGSGGAHAGAGADKEEADGGPSTDTGGVARSRPALPAHALQHLWEEEEEGGGGGGGSGVGKAVPMLGAAPLALATASASLVGKVAVPGSGGQPGGAGGPGQPRHLPAVQVAPEAVVYEEDTIGAAPVAYSHVVVEDGDEEERSGGDDAMALALSRQVGVTSWVADVAAAKAAGLMDATMLPPVVGTKRPRPGVDGAPSRPAGPSKPATSRAAPSAPTSASAYAVLGGDTLPLAPARGGGSGMTAGVDGRTDAAAVFDAYERQASQRPGGWRASDHGGGGGGGDKSSARKRAKLGSELHQIKQLIAQRKAAGGGGGAQG